MTIAQTEICSDLFSMPMGMFVIMGAIAVVAIVFGSIASAVTKISVARERERSRRELAAYVAEGTIDPDKAIAMLEAGPGVEDA